MRQLRRGPLRTVEADTEVHHCRAIRRWLSCRNERAFQLGGEIPILVRVCLRGRVSGFISEPGFYRSPILSLVGSPVWTEMN